MKDCVCQDFADAKLYPLAPTTAPDIQGYLELIGVGLVSSIYRLAVFFPRNSPHAAFSSSIKPYFPNLVQLNGLEFGIYSSTVGKSPALLEGGTTGVIFSSLSEPFLFQDLCWNRLLAGLTTIKNFTQYLAVYPGAAFVTPTGCRRMLNG